MSYKVLLGAAQAFASHSSAGGVKLSACDGAVVILHFLQHGYMFKK